MRKTEIVKCEKEQNRLTEQNTEISCRRLCFRQFYDRIKKNVIKLEAVSWPIFLNFVRL